MPVIHIVDDDPSVRKSLSRLLGARGWTVRDHASAEHFLDGLDETETACLLLDLRMPGMDGMALQAELNRRGVPMPIVFMTGHGDIPLSVKAMKAGAVDFLPKPFSNDDLWKAIDVARTRAYVAYAACQERAVLRQRYDTLTEREREVLAGVAAGNLNKIIAADLGITEKTVKVHRASALKKLAVRSVPELMRALERLGID